MYKIPGCIIKAKIFESPNTLIYRGTRQSDQQPVILKILKEDYPSPEELVRYLQEYEITVSLDVTGVIRAYGQEKYGNTLAIILEDFGGESLSILGKRMSFTPAQVLGLIKRVALILGEVHKANIIHKDVNPSNIVYNPETDELRLIDFGLSTRLSRETPQLKNPEKLEGTLAYISPEQTGRMNRALDYRTDFYALGVTLYELLAGRLPFTARDPLELTHCHLAREPVSPDSINPEISESLSRVVLKLLAKRAEDRYQTTRGLVADLDYCLDELAQKTDDRPFTPGSSDVSADFQLPQKLYGREAELETLLETAKRATSGRSEALFVAGYSGVGKSVLIKELYGILIRPEPESGTKGNNQVLRRGYFISGKFDQYHRDIPYSAAQAAFRDLIRQLLTESEKRLSRWKKNILEALGANGRIMTDFLPELKLIIGDQPPVPELDAAANSNRFTVTLRNFINVFLNPSHPLLLFLDDLQWGDLASLELLKQITTNTRHLFLIGAYRDNETGPGHPLLLIAEEMREAGVPLEQIALPPLGLEDIQNYISDATRRKVDETKELAELIIRKTDGNPFFTSEFLKAMVREELLSFDVQQGYWIWDINQVQEQNITDNVVELISDRVRELETDAGAALTRAACLGNTFDLGTLAAIHGKSPVETAGDLWPALEQNLLLPLRDEYKIAGLKPPGIPTPGGKKQYLYKFAHDRIAEAAYTLIPEGERIVLHLKVGRLLWREYSEESPAGMLFTIVDHLNTGRELLEEQGERDQVAELNLRAGQGAQASGAFGPALRYYKTGLELLGADSWSGNYKLTLKLFSRGAEVAMLARNFEEMEGFAEQALENSRDILDSVNLYEIRIQALIARHNPVEAVKLMLFALEKLGIKLPARPGQLRVLFGLILTKLRLAGKSPEFIIKLPAMEDPKARAAARILERAATAIYVGAPDLLPLVVFENIKLALKYGNAPETPVYYAAYGMILTGALGDLKSGYDYGNLALRLIDHLDVSKVRAKVMYIVNYFNRPWKKPIRETIGLLPEQHRIGLETGDLEFASIAWSGSGDISILTGVELSKLEKDMVIHVETVSELGQNNVLNYLNVELQTVRQLREMQDPPSLLEGEAYCETNMPPTEEAYQDKFAIFFIYTWKLILSYLYQESPEVVVRNADVVEKYLDAGMCAPGFSVFPYYDSLARLASYESASKSERKGILKKVMSNQKQIKKWAEHAPENQWHHYYLVGAEEARVLGRDLEARKLYELAADRAQEYDFRNDEALAWELGGRFYLKNNLLALARFYLKSARYAYSRWGADGKVIHLEKLYPEIFDGEQGSIVQNLLSSKVSISTHNNSSNLNLSTIIKASQAISSEIVLDSLLRNMMRLMIENAGAQKGCFILEKQGEFFLEAREEVGPEGGFIFEGHSPQPVRDESNLPLSLLVYTMRTGQLLVLADARKEGDFTGSDYIRENQVVSVLCLPVHKQGQVIGLLYLENNLTPGAFTAAHVEVIEILSAQIDLSIENAQLYANLEDKVKERTTQLESALGDVQALKNRQDGDYFLTSILLKPLSENTATDKIIRSDMLIKQYKQFAYQKWTAELGGDVCACHDLTLRGNTYTLFLNADAMGKSMQGAGGCLVLLTALKAMLGKVNSSPVLQDQTPESWIALAYLELHSIFATFEGGMQVSLLMGLADGGQKRIYFLNADHPRPVLLRGGRAEYFGPEFTTSKLGSLEADPAAGIEVQDLESGDMVIMGSDGKDDLVTGLDAAGYREIQDDENVFLECVLEAKGDPAGIRKRLQKRGDFIDDFSLLRLRVT